MEGEGGLIRVVAGEGAGEALEARLTRYLIADDVEVANRSGEFRLFHFPGEVVAPAEGVVWVGCDRFGVPGVDGWVGVGEVVDLPGREMGVDDVEALRISNGIPAWGRELKEGMLPPEAGLDGTDIAYDKGCYIGQDVISRIKSAGKVNRSLVKLAVPEGVSVEVGEVLDDDGKVLGEITSVGPIAEGGVRPVLGYVRRGVEPERLLRLPG
jgi:folate-binding protein YgfZ